MKRTITRWLMAGVMATIILGGVPFTGLEGNDGSGLFITTAQAQAAAAGTEVQQGPPETLGDYFRGAGITKWPLVASLIWITSLVIELIIRARVSSLCPPTIVAQLSSAFAVKDYVKAWQLCIDTPSALSRAMAPAIEKIPQGATASADAAMDYMNFQNNIFKVKCSYLNLNATVNTLLGLFGTITGMISAFNKMAFSGATGDPAKLAGSIGEALICTWIGLGAAILSLYLFYVLTNRAKAAMTGMQNIITRLLDEVDFASITPDMEIVTREMKARALGGQAGGGASKAAAVAVPKSKTAPRAPTAAPKAANAAEMVQCPHCQHQIQVGTAKCPNCQSALEWE
ncbi:MAG: MotA/TolQ/ExbB proton channel family protein [Kiritimatiellaeota bacterium]|nr:MotA/TolQ/ExbB proton channel family protein [Kiritimatiellota bacterium]